MLIAIDGEKGSSKDTDNNVVREWPEGEARWNTAMLHAIRLPQTLPALLNSETKLSPWGEVNINDRATQGVVIAYKERNIVSLFFDKENGLPAKSELQLIDPKGVEQRFEFIFEDYQESNGVKLPMRVTIRTLGKDMKLELSEFRAGKVESKAPEEPNQPKAQLEAKAPLTPRVTEESKPSAEFARALRTHKKDVWRVSFRADSSAVVSAGDDSEVVEWDVKSGNEIKRHRQGDFIHGLAHDFKGQWFASASMTPYGPGFCGTAKLFHLPTRQTLDVESRSAWSFSCAAIHKDGKWLALGGSDRALRVWDLESFLKLASKSKPAIVPLKLNVNVIELTPIAAPGEISTLSFQPAGQQLAVGLNNGGVIIYDLVPTKDPKKKLAKPSPLYTIEPASAKLEGHNKGVRCIAYGPDGRVLASASHDGNVVLWDSKTGERMKDIAASEAQLEWVAWHPNGRYLATAGQDRMVRVWSVATGDKVLELTKHTATVMGLAFSPDGRWLASASAEFTVGLWSIKGFGESEIKKTTKK